MPEARISRHRFHYHLVNGCAVVRPEGACDEDKTEALAKFVNSPLLESKDLVLDLSHVKYVESPGFRWIVRQVRSLESSGRSLILAGLQPTVDRAYRLLMLDRVVPAARDVPEALMKVHGGHHLLMAGVA